MGKGWSLLRLQLKFKLLFNYGLLLLFKRVQFLVVSLFLLLQLSLLFFQFLLILQFGFPFLFLFGYPLLFIIPLHLPIQILNNLLNFLYPPTIPLPNNFPPNTFLDFSPLIIRHYCLNYRLHSFYCPFSC